MYYNTILANALNTKRAIQIGGGIVKTKEELRAYNRAYYRKRREDPEKVKRMRQASKKWRDNNREKVRESYREYYRNNTEKVHKKNKDYWDRTRPYRRFINPEDRNKSLFKIEKKYGRKLKC